MKMSYTMKKTLLCLVMAVCAMLMASCEKNAENPTLVGKWTNTAESFQDNIAGSIYLSAGAIDVEFTASKVCFTDNERGDNPVWNSYSVIEEDGKQLLKIKSNDIGRETYVIEKLTQDSLVLNSLPYFGDAGEWLVLVRK